MCTCRPLLVVHRLIGGALPLIALAACAGTFDGEVDGDALPPLMSGFWLEGGGEGFRVNATASTALDLCGATAAMTRELVEVVKTTADEVDEDDDADDVYDDLEKAYEESWRRHMPENFWTVGASIYVKDDDDLVDDYGLGEDADLDAENPAFAGVSVCHQEGFLSLDDDGSDDNRTCYTSKSGDLEVTAFDDRGSIELYFEAELAESDDLDDEVGDVEATLRMGGCAALEDASKDLEDANEDLVDALSGDDDPPGEGEGEGEDVTCYGDSDCLTGNRLCDMAYGLCVDPALVTGGCSGATYFDSRDTDGPVVYAATTMHSTVYCDDELTVSFSIYDPNDELGESPYVTAMDDDGYSVSVMSTTNYGGSLSVKVCPEGAPTPIAIQVENQLGLASNALCAAP